MTSPSPQEKSDYTGVAIGAAIGLVLGIAIALIFDFLIPIGVFLASPLAQALGWR